MKNLTADTLFSEDFIIYQHKYGYRYGIDPVLLSHFVSITPNDKVMDFGTGCGIIPIILAHRNKNIKIHGCEIQDKLFSLAEKNISASPYKDRIKIIHADIKKIDQFFPENTFDIIVSNPPYTKKNSGRLNPNIEKAIARHEIKITLKELLISALKILKKGGAFYVIYPFTRKTELLEELCSFRLYPEIIRDIYTKNQDSPSLTMIKAVSGEKTEKFINNPLYIYNDKNEYSDEIKNYFSP